MDCDCEPDRPSNAAFKFDYARTCELCGFEYESSHCPHDGVQNKCRQCGWIGVGKETPFQFLGFTAPKPS